MRASGTRRGLASIAKLSMLLLLLLLLLSLAAGNADAQYPAPNTGSWTARDFRFHTGETMPELKLGYATVGASTGTPVLVLHGTAGSAANMLNPGFAGELFGPGQPLDASRYYVILPDAIGAGGSSKPSDGMRTKFPRFNYDDMVSAQHRLVTEGLGVKHLRLVIGNSMGGMHVWIWGVKHPAMMDALVPMAAQPTAMSSRNWMLRRMIVESIKRDPAYMDGSYSKQPPSMHIAATFFSLATNGGTLSWQKRAATREAGDKVVADMLAAPFRADANDYIYQWEAARDYDPSPGLERIQAMLMAINSADDERNPPETGLMDAAMKRVKNGRLLLIQASTDTRGHGTTNSARHWKGELLKLLETAPKRGS